MSANPKPSVLFQNVDEIKHIFKRFDANGDGKICFAELTGVMRALDPDTSQAEVAQMMAEIDTDKDGFIDLQEFAEFCSQHPDGLGSGAAELRDAFELYDQDKNGLISSGELHHILNRLGEKCTEQDCIKMIASVDSNGDGFVSFEEFKKMMTSSMFP